MIDIIINTDEIKKDQGNLFGIFFEDLNHAADGGLYGELVQNRSFEFEHVDRDGYHSLTAWKPVMRGESLTAIHTETRDPLNANNLHYVVVEILTAGEGGGISNQGFGAGIPIHQGDTYLFSTFYRIRGQHEAEVKVRLESKDGSHCYAEESFTAAKGVWTKAELSMTANGTDYEGRLVLLAKEPVILEMDMISLFPEKTFHNRRNGLRQDIAQMLEDMKPKFVRFPGGCLTHIGSLECTDRSAMYRWKNTLGAVEERPSKRNNWNYNQTLGLGFFEFFLFCEDIGAEPLPVIAAGYDPHFLRMTPFDKMQEWVEEALDLIEFATGTEKSKWGAIRASMGHPEPFSLKYLAIGNEEVGDAFFERFELIAKAVREKYPEIQLIGSAGPGSAGSEFNKGWNQAKEMNLSFVDEHFYQCPEWFTMNHERYQNYPKCPKAFVGEYASLGDAWKNALMESVFMIGLEKAEGVGLACYAPMLCHVDYQDWKPDMIYYDNHRVYGSPSYYVQKMFMNYQGESLLETKDNMMPVEDKKKSLSGRVSMVTENACVAVSNFQIKDENSNLLHLQEDFCLDKEYSQKICADLSCENYEICFDFCRRKGSKREMLEGVCRFELQFGEQNPENKMIWRFDSWEQMMYLCGIYEGKEYDCGLELAPTQIDYVYHARLVVRDGNIQTYINEKMYHSYQSKEYRTNALYYSVTKDKAEKIFVKVANVENMKKRIHFSLISDSNRIIWKKAKIHFMAGWDFEMKNSFDNPEKVSPKTEECMVVDNQIYYLIPAQAFCVIEVIP